ncbi:uncharacterized protein METZ01_LOCUS392361, partial [marine metagenome]
PIIRQGADQQRSNIVIASDETHSNYLYLLDTWKKKKVATEQKLPKYF